MVSGPSHSHLRNRAAQVNPDLQSVIGDAQKLYYMFYFWGYSSAFVVYSVLCYFWPPENTMVAHTILGDSDVIAGEAVDEEKGDSDGLDEKKGMDTAQEAV